MICINLPCSVTQMWRTYFVIFLGNTVPHTGPVQKVFKACMEYGSTGKGKTEQFTLEICFEQPEGHDISHRD